MDSQGNHPPPGAGGYYGGHPLRPQDQSMYYADADRAEAQLRQQRGLAPMHAPSGVLQAHLNRPPVPPPQPPAPPQAGMRELRVEDALLYLDEVKREFRDRPSIYNEFLSIMKHFKTQEVDTPGVIRRVSLLFKGYPRLILGFNTFLPDGYKINPKDLDEMGQMVNTTAAKPEETKPIPQAAPKPPPPPPQSRKASPAKSPTLQSKQQPQAPQQQPQQQQPQQHQTVEFDHAISYVTKIKRRFANDPGTYHAFLEILHTYQKEQRGIKEVLEQVAHLFQDHPDLLKEFTFFLPDAVQEQAKERLHHAAAEAESRQAIARQQQIEQNRPQKFIDMTEQRMERGQKSADTAEQFVYNAAVERQFFDAAREALASFSRDGGQAWAEFLKCLDLYAQEILSHNEMLAFVEPLLGKRNTKLFEEFKRILNAASSPSTNPMEDSWYSVPLSEIDFSRCRRCSPSYRALPRDYPAHPCTDRSPEEAKVLNDVWVSLPVGSEESYTFRHMRRNTYEETLFRVEDERFEIDMAIGLNAATLQRLEPVAEEIAQLAKEEPSGVDGTTIEGSGFGGRRFQYTFDKSILGVLHRGAIARIYGESGQEMLDLMFKNPTVAVPIVVQRLRQKDEEWKVVRERLTLVWRELAAQTYFKSLDHRALTWRTVDKRATSTRTLVADIKDRAQNGGKESKDAYRQKLDKAKEEKGTFVEVTMRDSLTRDLDLNFLPKPDRRLFTPHHALLFENNSWAQKDAYRILTYALERGQITPADKERCHRLWIDFLGPWFGLSCDWMLQPAVSFQESVRTTDSKLITPPSIVSEEEDEESMDEEPEVEGNVVTEELRQNDSNDSKIAKFPDHHPLPSGAPIVTIYGLGKVLKFRKEDCIYEVRLGFASTAYLRPSAILCSGTTVEKTAYTRQLRSEDPTKLSRTGDQLVFGTQSLYVFFRLHQILIQRLNTARHLAFSADNDITLQSMIEQMPGSNPKAVGRRRYETYLSLVYALLDGGAGGAAEGGKYEDRVRSLLGNGAYELATMDKLIGHIWKNLQSVAQDETMWSLVQVYRRHKEEGSFQPEAFRQEAAYLSEGEFMYAFQHCPVQTRDQSVLYTEYLGVMDEDAEDVQDQDDDEEDEDESEHVSKKQKR